jgi:hypothetical protein
MIYIYRYIYIDIEGGEYRAAIVCDVAVASW